MKWPFVKRSKYEKEKKDAAEFGRIIDVLRMDIATGDAGMIEANNRANQIITARLKAKIRELQEELGLIIE